MATIDPIYGTEGPVMAAIIGPPGPFTTLDGLLHDRTIKYVHIMVEGWKEWMMEGENKEQQNYTPQSVFPPALLHVQSYHSCH